MDQVEVELTKSLTDRLTNITDIQRYQRIKKYTLVQAIENNSNYIFATLFEAIPQGSSGQDWQTGRRLESLQTSNIHLLQYLAHLNVL